MLHPSLSTRNQPRCLPRSEIANGAGRVLLPVPLASSHFLDAYLKGRWNLSTVPCPPCLEYTAGLMKAPESYTEVARRRAIEHYKNLPQWNDTVRFKQLVRETARVFGVRGCTLSLIEQSKQVVKYSHGWDILECPRKLALDGHAILSLGSFVLLDASTDWRTANNPFVRGIPGIRFYAAVPLMLRSGNALGTLAIFDHLPRDAFEDQRIESLVAIARGVMTVLHTAPAHTPASMGGIGRATSRSDSHTALIFEKDGSGGPYHQNHAFRLDRYDETAGDVDVWRAVYQAHGIKPAAAALCRIIATKKPGLDLIYIMEIRIVELFLIQSEFFPAENKVAAETYRHANQLVRTGAERVTTRLMGIYGSSTALVGAELALHRAAFASEFGCLYKSTTKDTRFLSGLEMPFYRHPARLERRLRILPGQALPPGQVLSVLHTSGGYLIGAYSERDAEFSNATVDMLFTSASMLRTIYLTTE